MRPDKDIEVAKTNGLYPYVQQFLEWTLVKGFSKDTATRRRMALKKFILWCQARELQRPQDITKPILDRYQRHLYYYRKSDGQPLSFGSQNVCLSPIKSFFKWLTREHHILYNPASELELPKKTHRLPRSILHLHEIETILQQPERDTDEGIRDRAILETLYSTGIRRTEVTHLKIYDIDARRQTLLVRDGKNGQDRVLPIGERALAWIEKYQWEVRPRYVIAHDEGYLFLTDEGQKFKRGTLSGRVKRYLRQAGITVQGSCHLFRHAMATHMLENGADIRFIQVMLGHRDLNTTQIYTHVSIEKLKQIHAATHPTTHKMQDVLLNRLHEEVMSESDDDA